MRKHIVCMTFDFDAISGWIAKGMTTPTPVSRGEFGVVGAQRILALLKQFDMPSTWFIPGHTIETYPEMCRRVFDAGHEIGNHGWTHVPPGNMSAQDEEAGLVRSNEAIRRLTGLQPRGYRSPSWDLSSHSVDLLLQHGFKYDSSMMADDYTPYRVRAGDVIELNEPAVFGRETALIEMPISWALDDYPHFEFVRTQTTLLPGSMNASSVIENWVEEFLYMKETMEWGILTYTFHPFVIGRGHRMRALERLIRRLSDEGAEFMRMDAAVEQFERRHPARIASDIAARR